MGEKKESPKRKIGKKEVEREEVVKIVAPKMTATRTAGGES